MPVEHPLTGTKHYWLPPHHNRRTGTPPTAWKPPPLQVLHDILGAELIEQVITAAEAQQQRTVTITDLVPVQAGDARGLTGFYLVIGWIVGGYLVAALLGVAKAPNPLPLGVPSSGWPPSSRTRCCLDSAAH